MESGSGGRAVATRALPTVAHAATPAVSGVAENFSVKSISKDCIKKWAHKVNCEGKDHKEG